MTIDNKVIVSVYGGVADFVYAPKGIECYIVDWDNLDGNNWCPICNVDLYENICPECGTDFSRDSEGHIHYSLESVMENFLKARGIE